MDWQRVKCDSANSCVEVAIDNDNVHLRTADQIPLTITEDEWHAFKDAIKAGQFD
jgi:hypothetical protein